MRLIAEFKNEKEAFGFQTFLQKEKIPCSYEAVKDPEPLYRLWIVEEDDFEKAWSFFEEWKKNPNDPRFSEAPEKIISTTTTPGAKPWKIRSEMRQKPRFTLNNFIIALCVFVFFLNGYQALKMEQQKGIAALQLGFTPIQKALLFDYPSYFDNFEKFLSEYSVKNVDEIKKLPPEVQECFKKVQDAPTWKGITDMAVNHNWKVYKELPPGTLFGKIRQGEIWRLISPVILHGNLLHILFNLSWVWILGKQVEPRIGAWKYLILSVIIGVVGNVAEYIMTGPAFIGYSGIVVGLVGFIWMRQKMAPWEGYPLQRAIIIFIVVFVLAMLVLELVSMGLEFFHVTELYANIANTAHIIGGITGILLARLPFFSRSHR